MFAEGASTLKAVSELATTLRARRGPARQGRRLRRYRGGGQVGAAHHRRGREGQGVAARARLRGAGGAASAQRRPRLDPTADQPRGERRTTPCPCCSRRKAASPRGRCSPRSTRSGRAAEKPGAGRRTPARAALRPRVPAGRPGPPAPREELPRRVREARARRGPARRAARSDGDGSMGQAGADFRAALANLRAVSEKIKSGEGTVGALIEDPTVYENLVTFLEGAQRSLLLRSLVRSTIQHGRDGQKEEVVARERSTYRCQACGFAAPKAGTCPDCARLGTFVALVEERAAPVALRAAPARRRRAARAHRRDRRDFRRAHHHGHRRARSRARRRRRARLARAHRRRPRHRQVHPAAPGEPLARRSRGPRALRLGRGVGGPGQAARGPARHRAARALLPRRDGPAR